MSIGVDAFRSTDGLSKIGLCAFLEHDAGKQRLRAKWRSRSRLQDSLFERRLARTRRLQIGRSLLSRSSCSGPVPSIQCASEASLCSDVSGFSGRSPTTFTHPAKSLYRRELRSTLVVTMTSATCLSSRQQAPTTSPPGREGARRADEGDFPRDIRVFADRHLSCRSRGRPLIACRHFSPWGRSRSVYAGLLTVGEKMCECRRDGARE